ncbi:uncharacterized protein LOC111389617 [Olea europaea var. sylvestris]|uniref:uncharacterized protein LOC111389617 n=1 Tax=Olea europaea var. sylvestris TaxID=158386 RepID=UPI000C1D7934|nr:uncharacterized protein LOC111389617 [Olea europaea var. sylvestris]
MGVDAELLKKIVAFWLWLESQGVKEILKKVGFQDDKTVALISLEAEIALTALENHNLQDPSSSNICLHVTSNVVSNGSIVPLEEILEDKNKAWSGISQLLNGVCRNICFSVLEEQPERRTSKLVEIVHRLFQPFENSDEDLGTVSKSDSESSSLASSGLNPLAEEWRPNSEAERSLYVTFSHGFPLSPTQIYLFFTWLYGDCLEKVYVHHPRNAAGPPHFGRIMFKRWWRWLPESILMGQEQVRFDKVFGRSLWCKKFRPKNNRIDNA